METEGDRARLRLAHADREAAVAHLRGCTQDGRLSLDEFTHRVDAVYQAVTFGDLEPVMSDLPSIGKQVTGPPSAEVLEATGSALKRKGEWLAPASMVLRVKGCLVRLDFSHAVLPGPSVDIEVDSVRSSIKLYLPRNSWAADSLDLTSSRARNKAARGDDRAGTRFTIGGNLDNSSLVILRRRR